MSRSIKFLKEYEQLCIRYGYQLLDSNGHAACLYELDDDGHTLYYDPDTAEVIVLNDEGERAMADMLLEDEDKIVCTVKELEEGAVYTFDDEGEVQ